MSLPHGFNYFDGIVIALITFMIMIFNLIRLDSLLSITVTDDANCYHDYQASIFVDFEINSPNHDNKNSYNHNSKIMGAYLFVILPNSIFFILSLTCKS